MGTNWGHRLQEVEVQSWSSNKYTVLMMDTYLTGVHTSVWGDLGGSLFLRRFSECANLIPKELGWCITDKRVGGLMSRISHNATVGAFVVSVFSFYGDFWSISSFICLIKKEIQLLYCCNMLWHMNRMRQQFSTDQIMWLIIMFLCSLLLDILQLCSAGQITWRNFYLCLI